MHEFKYWYTRSKTILKNRVFYCILFGIWVGFITTKPIERDSWIPSTKSIIRSTIDTVLYYCWSTQWWGFLSFSLLSFPFGSIFSFSMSILNISDAIWSVPVASLFLYYTKLKICWSAKNCAVQLFVSHFPTATVETLILHPGLFENQQKRIADRCETKKFSFDRR